MCAFNPTCLNQVLCLRVYFSLFLSVMQSGSGLTLRLWVKFFLFSVAQTKSYSSRPGCFHRRCARSRSLWSLQVESCIVFIESTRSWCEEGECILTPTCWVNVCVCVCVCVVSPLPLASVEVCARPCVCVCVWVGFLSETSHPLCEVIRNGGEIWL